MAEKGGNRLGAGRPSQAFSTKDLPPSRSKFQCPVCGSEKRSDKMQQHLLQLCHFDNDGMPVKPDNPQYSSFTSEAKQHTDYCVAKELKKDSLLQSWKRLSG